MRGKLWESGSSKQVDVAGETIEVVARMPGVESAVSAHHQPFSDPPDRPWRVSRYRQMRLVMTPGAPVPELPEELTPGSGPGSLEPAVEVSGRALIVASWWW